MKNTLKKGMAVYAHYNDQTLSGYLIKRFKRYGKVSRRVITWWTIKCGQEFYDVPEYEIVPSGMPEMKQADYDQALKTVQALASYYSN